MISGTSGNWLKRVTRTYVLVVVCVIASAVLGSVFSVFWMHHAFSSYHTPVAGDTELENLRARIAELNGIHPRITLLVELDEASAPATCPPGAVRFTRTMTASPWRASRLREQVDQEAQLVGLGASCDGSFPSFSVEPAMGGFGLVLGTGTIGFVILVLVRRARRGRRTIGINWADWTPRIDPRWVLGWGMAGGAAVFLAVAAASWIAILMGADPGTPPPMPERGIGLFLIAGLAIVGAPVFEEYVFRAWLLERLGRDLPVWLAFAIATAVFAGVHLPQHAVQWLALLLAGAGFGLLWLRTRSLPACAVAHGLYNAVVFALALHQAGGLGDPGGGA